MVYDHGWSYVTIYDHICYHIWMYMIVYDHVWSYVLIYVIICGCVRSVRARPRTTLWPHKDPQGLPWDAPEISETLKGPHEGARGPLRPDRGRPWSDLGTQKLLFPCNESKISLFQDFNLFFGRFRSLLQKWETLKNRFSTTSPIIRPCSSQSNKINKNHGLS